MIRLYLELFLADHGYTVPKPYRELPEYIEFKQQDGRLISFEYYPNDGSVDCYYEQEPGAWHYTNNEKEFIGMWERFIQ